MITVIIQIEVNDMTLQFEKKTYGMAGGHSGLDAEKAQALLLEGYQKINKGIESQK
jgi:hypothetical protein